MARRYMRHSETLKRLIKEAKRVTDKQVGEMAKARLVRTLVDDAAEPRTMIQATRMGLEVGGSIGPARETSVKHTIEIPKAAQEMIARRIFELQKKSEAITVEAEDAHPRSALPLEDASVREETTSGVRKE